MNAYSGPPITLGNAASARVRAIRSREINGETQRSVARSYTSVRVRFRDWPDPARWFIWHRSRIGPGKGRTNLGWESRL